MSDDMDDVEVLDGGDEDEEQQAGAASDEEEEDKAGSSAPSTPVKGNKKATAEKGKGKAASAAAASSKKASPKKRKADGDASSPAKKAAKGASGAKQAAPDDPKEFVRQYMVQQNRPYTALVVYENLHQQIKKPALIRIMDELTEEGHLQVKDFKKVRMYLAKQADSSVPDPDELASLGQQEAQVKEELSAMTATNSRLDAQVRMLQNQPNDEDLAAQLAQYKKQVDSLNARLARIKSEGKQVDKAGMNRVQLKFNDALTHWIKRRRAAMDLLDQMAGEEGDPKEVVKRLSLETDEDAEVNLAEWKDLKKDIKK